MVMQHRNILIIFYLAVILTMSPGNNIFSQNLQQRATRQSSLEAYNRGDYEKAYFEFSGLLEKYPKDPLYKYYAGVCLIRINREPEKALLFLQQAQQGSAVVRTVPDDIVFWQGRAQQQCGQFSEAENSYIDFSVFSGRKRARDYGVQDLIQQCREKKDFTGKNEIQAEIDKKEEPEVIEEQKTVREISEKTDEKIIPESEILPKNYDKILSEALEYQALADSLKRVAEEQGRSIQDLDYKGKTELRNMILETESLAADYQKKADEKYEEAQLVLNRVEFAAEKIGMEMPALRIDTVNPGKEVVEIPEPDNFNVIKSDSTEVKRSENVNGKQVKVPVIQSEKDSTVGKVNKTEKVSVPQKTVSVFSLFETNPKRVYEADEKIPVDPSIPSGLIYRIQVAVFRNPVSPTYFKGISPVYGFKVTGTDKTGYFAGMFRKHTDAAKALILVKQAGFRDAFIVSLSGGKAVSAERATLLEKEWGNKPLIDAAEHTAEDADTIPPTLSFRIEIARESKPAREDVIETYRRLAGTRGLDTFKLNDGTNIYLVGHFITYESAEEYASLLARNGLRDAKVTAWLGRKEIPVDTARQLFEKLE
jgi:hypothetical protein